MSELDNELLDIVVFGISMERIPTTPAAGLAICTLKTCRWVGSLSESVVIRGLAFCPLCSCACEAESECDEPIILHASGEMFDPLAITK